MPRSLMFHKHVVGGLGVQRDEVPERVVRRLRLRDLPVRVRLGGVDDVGELDAVLDEEHRHVVADQVEVALVGVELHREAAGVAHGVGRPARAEHGREPDEHVGAAALLGQEAALVTDVAVP